MADQGKMTKKEIIIAISVLTAAILLVGAGLLWHSRQNKDNLSNSTQTSEVPDAGSNLSVNVAGASNLGQLGGNKSQSSGGNSGNSGTDTASFAQYDKYKDSKDALFGDIQKGTGAEFTNGKKGAVIYKGWLTNGALIDRSPVSSSGQPQPYSFTMGAHEVIPGWEEAMYGMKAGGTRLLIIPPAVGYGSQGKGIVPPNAVLVFQVQLSSVQ